MRYHPQRRRGTVVVETVIVYPVTFTLLLGLIIGGLGVLRYQEVASLAREGARYASVHGARSALGSGTAAATADDIYKNAIQPRLVALDPANVSYNVTWNPDNNQGSKVTVKVNYKWVPEAFLGGMTLTSTSVMVISY